MTSSTAKSLVQLIGMKISQCEMMKEIVIKEEKEGSDEIVFSKLKSLQLMYLGNLKSFCSCKEGLAFKFPSLENLILRDCFKMEYFCENIKCIPKLRKVYVVEEDCFKIKFKFPSLENLILRDCFKMEDFCEDIECIPKLREVYVVEEEGEVWPKQTQEEGEVWPKQTKEEEGEVWPKQTQEVKGKKWYWEDDLFFFGQRKMI
ncbi:hypothetical protein K1719_046689 [Acacia pycnantha]|nr:hypothetical protein K1719_046689 [Acacia pycnantha]